MKISINLLRQFTNIEISIDELLERIATRIGEIDSVEKLGIRYEHIVVGEIFEAKAHPDADKLGIYQVNVGAGKSVQVVAGDKTLKKSDKVAYIPPGTTVPATSGDTEPLVIEKRELRGELSDGMLASAKELAFGEDHSGVLVLETDQDAGTPLTDVYDLDDTVIEIENKALTHRPDCFGHIGFAREVAGLQQMTFSEPDWLITPQAEHEKPPAKMLAITGVNEDPQACNRLTLQALSNLNNGSSPLYMRSYLQRLGIRSLNSIVDVTNYLMLLTGQPMHAFDYDKLMERSRGELVLHARRAKPGETLKLLTGKTINLDAEDLVIATDQEPVALAGVMGGADTEVDEQTTKIVLEAANFDMYVVRNASMRHGLFTEAVTRFARGQDPALCSAAQYKAAELLKEISGGTVASELFDVFDNPRAPKGVVVETSRINKLLGSSYSDEEMAATLRSVGLDTVINKDRLDITVPTWRPDITIEEDIAEEIGRLHGYDNIPVTLPRRDVSPVPVDELLAQRRSLSEWLRYAGAHELLNYSGVSSRLLNQSGQDSEAAFTIQNALSPELEHMRLSLTPSILEKVYANLRQGYEQFALFEAGTTHHKSLMQDDLPQEQPSLAFGLFAGKKSALSQGERGAAYYQAAYWLREMLKSVGMSKLSFEPLQFGTDKPHDPWTQAAVAPFESKRSALILSNGQLIGVVGEFSAGVHRAFKLPGLSAGFELHRVRLAEVLTKLHHTTYQPLSKYPSVENDITFKAAVDVPFAQVAQELESGLQKDGLHTRITPIDIYQAESSQDKHLTFRVWVWSNEKTLTSQEVNDLIDAAVDDVGKKCGTSRV